MSQPNSVSGSPPQHAEKHSTQSEAVSPIGEAIQSEDQPSNAASSPPRRPSMPSGPPPPPPTAPQYNRPLPPLPNAPRQKGATRKMSKGGGVQMVLEETGSWSELADQSSTLPAEGYEGAGNKGKGSNSGMLSFFSRKKGRVRSPKPMEPGVLGKEGARHIIS